MIDNASYSRSPRFRAGLSSGPEAIRIVIKVTTETESWPRVIFPGTSSLETIAHRRGAGRLALTTGGRKLAHGLHSVLIGWRRTPGWTHRMIIGKWQKPQIACRRLRRNVSRAQAAARPREPPYVDRPN